MEMKLKTIQKHGHKLSAKELIRAKKIDYIARQLEQSFRSGHLPFCMDDADDRDRMAEWIFDNAQM